MAVNGKLPKLIISGLEEKKKQNFIFERENSHKDTFLFRNDYVQFFCVFAQVHVYVSVCACVKNACM
jgi:hypothetical protein